MQCFRPIYVYGRDSPPVPCGKCFACQSNRRRDFHMRIKYEMLHSLYSLTVTLTYDDEHLPGLVPYYFEHDPIKRIDNPECYYYHPIDLDHVQRFFKRLRKTYKFRYFGVGEYGSKRGRPHYHIIFFFNDLYDWRKFKLDVYKQWPYGVQITIDETNDDCIGYTLKYCLKPYTSTDPNPHIFLSKRPYIGHSYLTPQMSDYLLYNNFDQIVTTINGRQRLPRIYRDKVFSSVFDEDRLELQKANLQSFVEDQEINDKLRSFELGITYQDYLKQKRDAFTTRVWKQIKKKSL